MNASARRTKLARLMNDPNALPLTFNIDKDGHEYAADLFDSAAQTDAPETLF